MKTLRTRKIHEGAGMASMAGINLEGSIPYSFNFLLKNELKKISSIGQFNLQRKKRRTLLLPILIIVLQGLPGYVICFLIYKILK